MGKAGEEFLYDTLKKKHSGRLTKKSVKTIYKGKTDLDRFVDYRNYETDFPISILGYH